ncbi:hypothetical protein HK097_007754 [Rhizophlyctis rosea]|uniref:sn-1-specific diacylglycerol lipase n=1 Tax=Rhizophlyctis rosea TaxID=64517 RepID=A0AAD5SB99_9FUNG|nr:hypothetical protein HK097_007754 [Rhizophlyctis rosea]
MQFSAIEATPTGWYTRKLLTHDAKPTRHVGMSDDQISSVPEVTVYLDQITRTDTPSTDVVVSVASDDADTTEQTVERLTIAARAADAATPLASTSLAIDTLESALPVATTHRPLLNKRMAVLISSFSTAARVSLRLSSLMVEGMFQSLKFSVSTSLGVTRRAMVAAISSARILHMLSAASTSADARFVQVLDRYTDAGWFALTLYAEIEMLSHATFHLTSSTICGTLKVAEEIVHGFDGLFGNTETSRAVAAFVVIIRNELGGHESDRWAKFGRMAAVGQVAKAMTAYCCLQIVNRKRWRNSLHLKSIFEGYATEETDHQQPFVKGALRASLSQPNHIAPDATVRPLPEVNLPEARPPPSGPLPRSLPTTPTRELPPPLGRRMSNPDGRTAVFLRQLEFERLMNSPGQSASTSTTRTDTPRLNIGQVAHVLRMLENVNTQRDRPSATSPTKKPRLCQSPAPMDSAGNCQLVAGTFSSTRRDSRLELFEKLERFGRFCTGAYGAQFMQIFRIGRHSQLTLQPSGAPSNHQSFAFHTEVPIEHIVTSSFGERQSLHPPALHAPIHYVVADAVSKSVVVTLRGTLGLSDLITDLTSQYDPLTVGGVQGKVHSGMLASARKVATGSVRDTVIEALERHPDFGLVLTGHSLGGGVAALLTLLWAYPVVEGNGGGTTFMTGPRSGLPCRPIHCFVYGPPAVMSANLSTYAQNMITTVIYRNDFIPSLSLGLMRDYKTVVLNLCHERGLPERIIAKVLGVFPGSQNHEDSAAVDELWFWALQKTLRADMRSEKLYPPGIVYWIDAMTPMIPASVPLHPLDQPGRTRRPITVHLVEDVETAFSDFTFSKSMFLDHAPDRYEKALQSLLNALTRRGASVDDIS